MIVPFDGGGPGCCHQVRSPSGSSRGSFWDPREDPFWRSLRGSSLFFSKKLYVAFTDVHWLIYIKCEPRECFKVSVYLFWMNSNKRKKTYNINYLISSHYILRRHHLILPRVELVFGINLHVEPGLSRV
jgi:hypothetical protein